jgi:hypothetical protein
MHCKKKNIKTTTYLWRNRRNGDRRPSSCSATLQIERRAVQDDTRRKGEVRSGREDVGVVDFDRKMAINLARVRDLERCLRKIAFYASQGC